MSGDFFQLPGIEEKIDAVDWGMLDQYYLNNLHEARLLDQVRIILSVSIWLLHVIFQLNLVTFITNVMLCMESSIIANGQE